ncbi:hypothetical protein MNBD_GAMMA04-329 [hydrothermal vent metagenome]|uniref:DUF5666 domain-containing protein n=1 Tax=hydrothermal vent metagenome TaxID=652676 RepID=A0A3B0W3N4_9ZZZZ
MKHTAKLTALTMALSIITILVACGGGGSTSTTGIGGSGITTTGTITGFGSVIVNGVKFETTRSSFDIEGSPGTQNDLAIGMVVQVNGVINPDGVTGTATSIVFDDELQGSVNDFATDGLTATFTVLGIAVKVDSKTTYFDPDNGGISINTITNGQFVELSGFFDATGTLIASRIENKNGSDENVELKGNITNLVGTTFTLKGIEIDARTARLEDLPNGLTNNIHVEVKGRFDGTRIIATEVESEEIEYGDREEFEMEGYVTDFTSHSNFKVNGITVDASNNPKMEPSTMQLENNVQIEVEGYFVNGILIATELKMRGGEAEITASVSSINQATNSFTVQFESAQFIDVEITPETEIENGNYLSFLNHLTLSNIVEVEGYQKAVNGTVIIVASEIEIEDFDEDIEVQGVIESDPSLSTIKILGVEFTIDGNTKFKNSEGSYIVQTPDFSNLVTQNSSIIKVEDDYPPDGIADKIEIESP